MAIANIFCDASMDIKHGIGCAGVYMVSENFKEPIDYFYMKQYNATNNSAEILAVYNGVLMALYYRNHRPEYKFDKFRLFSDSKICIYGLREWCYDWVRNQNDYGYLRRNDLANVSNQFYFRDIIRLILDNDLYISFNHQKGHSSFTPKAMEISEKFFIDSNGYSPEDIGTTIRYINAYNIEVDQKSRDLLQGSSRVQIELYNPLISFVDNSEMLKFNMLTKW